MAFKPRTRTDRDSGGVVNPSNLTGLLRQTDLNQSDDKGDVALFQFLDTLVNLTKGLVTDLANTFKKTEKIILTNHVAGVLPPVNGGSFSEVYTPTLVNVANLTASTASRLGYHRIGNDVTVFGKVNVQTTGAGDTRLRISLPILSYFLNDFECSGVGSCPSVAGEVTAIFADTTNFDAEMRWQSGGGATFDIFFILSYQIIAKP